MVPLFGHAALFSSDLKPSLHLAARLGFQPGADLRARRDLRATGICKSTATWQTDEPIMATVAGRYASALFELANDERRLETVEADLAGLKSLLAESADLRAMVRSPVLTAEEQENAIASVAERAGFSTLSGNFLRLITRNRRLFALDDIIETFQRTVARHRGEVTAEVVSAHPLVDDQKAALEDALKGTSPGQNVKIEMRVDPALLGGLVVRMGSRMIDSSLRTKLDTLTTRMKEVR